MGAVLVGALFFMWHRTKEPQKFIVITGISSTGKSSAADSVKKLLGEDCAIVRLDDYIQKIVEAKARTLLWDEHCSVGPMDFIRLYYENVAGHAIFNYEIRAHKLDYAIFYDAIRSAAESYRYVIIDTVLESSRCRNELEDVIGKKDALWVLLYCPLHVIRQRLEDRAGMASFVHQGISLSTYESFLAIYTKNKGNHWTAVDIIDARETRILLDTSINGLLARVPYDRVMAYKDRCEIFRKRFLRWFGLEELHAAPASLPLYPVERYDLVLNSGTTSTEEISQKIKLDL